MSDEANDKKARIYLIQRVVTDLEGPTTEVVGVDLENSIGAMHERIDNLNKQEESKKKELIDFLAERVKEVVKLILTDQTFLSELNEEISYDEETAHLFLKNRLSLNSFNLPCLVDNHNLDSVIGGRFFNLLERLQEERTVIRGLEDIKCIRSPFFSNYFGTVRFQQLQEGNIDWLQYIEYFVNNEFYEYFCTYKFKEVELIDYDSMNCWSLK